MTALWSKRNHGRYVGDQVYEEIEDQYILTLPGTVGNARHSNAISIEAAYHYSGSGPKAFGGARQWPHIAVHFDIPPGMVKERDEIVERFAGFCEKIQLEFRLDESRLTSK